MIADEKFERNNQPDQKKEDFLMLEEELNQFGVSNECSIKLELFLLEISTAFS
jgi:hypothetical protein